VSIFFDSKPYSCFRDEVVKLCNLKKDDVFVDCGSNLGQEIDSFLDEGVIFDSYEPHPYFYKKLDLKYKNHERISLTNKAVWINSLNLEFYFKKPIKEWGDNHVSGGASLLRKTNHRGENVSVDCIDIVDVVKKHEKIKILKLDIEGAEYKVLRRLIETGLIDKPEFIFFEDHEAKVINKKDFIKDKRVVEKFVNDTKFKFYNW